MAEETIIDESETTTTETQTLTEDVNPEYMSGDAWE